MTATLEDIEKFKASFPKQLEEFIEKKKDDLGELNGWRIESIDFEINKRLALKSENKQIFFYIKTMPQEMDVKDKYELRVFIRKICNEAGFKKSKARVEPLSSEIIEKVRSGDPEAWQIWVKRHEEKILGYAKKLTAYTPTILNEEDYANIAFAKLYSIIAAGELKEKMDPQSYVGRVLTGLTNSRNLIKYHQQSKNYPWQEMPHSDFAETPYVDLAEELRVRLPVIFNAAKEHMSSKQQEIFSIIQQEENKNTLQELATKMGVTKMRISQQLQKIEEAIKKAANELAEEEPHKYEDVAVFIHSIDKANENVCRHKGRTR